MSVVIGIDTGKQGAIAIVRIDGPEFNNGEQVSCSSMPLVGKEYGEQQMWLAIVANDVAHVFIEKTAPRPPNTMSSAHTQGIGEGLWRGLCVACGAPYALVRAQDWQKVMFQGVAVQWHTKAPSKALRQARAACLACHERARVFEVPWCKKHTIKPTRDTKAMSILAAHRLFPGVSLLRTDKCKKPDDGMSDALLIAEYGRRVLMGDRQKETGGE